MQSGSPGIRNLLDNFMDHPANVLEKAVERLSWPLSQERPLPIKKENTMAPLTPSRGLSGIWNSRFILPINRQEADTIDRKAILGRKTSFWYTEMDPLDLAPDGGVLLSYLSLFIRRPAPELLPKPRTDFTTVPERMKFAVLTLFALLTVAAAFFFNSPVQILEGQLRILCSPGILLSDYMRIGNIGSAFFNSGLLMLAVLAIAASNKLTVSGPFTAALFTVGGFAFFGKNLYNAWPIMGGVLLYSKLQQEPFRHVILQAFFGTALGPLISQVSFGFGLPLQIGLPLGIAAGLMAGFILPPLANHFVRFHQGYNLYNIGFTAGIIGMLFMAIFRGLSLQNPPTLLLLEEPSSGLTLYLLLLFAVMLVIGLLVTVRPIQSLWDLWKLPGQLVSDFIASAGFGVTLLNMALLGFVSLAYVLLVGAPLNGPVLGGIFTVVGFGAFGKHVKNVLPIMAGIYLANLVFVWEAGSTGSVLAALFATTLAPVAGAYGIVPGLIAGFLHMAMVMNVGYLHGGLNLYNNGFSGGFVAAILIPVLDSVTGRLPAKKEKIS